MTYWTYNTLNTSSAYLQPISENDHDFIFLMPDKKKQVAILNKPFDSKKNIFVPLENGKQSSNQGMN